MSPILIENADAITRSGFRGGVRAFASLKFAKHMLYNVN